MTGSPRLVRKASSSSLTSAWPTCIEKREKKMLVVIKQFLSLFFGSCFSLEGTLTVVLGWKASGYWKTVYFRDLPSPCLSTRKVRKKAYLEHIPSVGICRGNAKWFSRQNLCLACTVIIPYLLSLAFCPSWNDISWMFFCHSLTQVHISLCCSIYHGSTAVWLKQGIWGSNFIHLKHPDDHCRFRSTYLNLYVIPLWHNISVQSPIIISLSAVISFD